MFRRALIPVDFSDYSRACLDWVGENLAGTELVLLHVWHGEHDSYTTWHGDPLRSAGEHIEEVVSKFSERFDNPTRLVVLEGHPATTICSEAKNSECDVIVMATHGRSGIQHLLMGSVAETVVRHASMPVLTMRI